MCPYLKSWMSKCRIQIRTQSLLLVLSSVLLAQDIPSAVPPPVELDLEMMVERTLANYFTIRIERFEVNRAEEDIRGAQSGYDPVISLSAEAGEQSAELSETGEREPYSTFGVSLEGTLPTGTGYGINVSTDRFYDGATADSRESNAASELNLILTQPLLRDWGGTEIRNKIRIARAKYEISEHVFAQVVMNAITEAQFAFLNAFTAEKTLKELEESRDLAKQLLEDNRKRIEIGSMAPNDLYQAQAELAARESQVYLAELELGNLQNVVRRFISGEIDGDIGRSLALGVPREVKPITVEVEKDLVIALELRPDYRQARLQYQEAGWNEKLRQSEAKPRVDLQAGISLAHTDDRVSRSWSDLQREDHATLFLGLEMEWAVPNRYASAERMKARFARQQAELSITDLEQLIHFRIDNAARRVDSSWNRLVSARDGLAVAEKSLQSEQRLLQTGNSSTFVVLRLQSDLARARIRELDAMNEYRQAALEYERQIGVTLRKNGISMLGYP